MTSKIRYNHEYLQQFCKENGIELTKDYSLEKVNRDTIIEAKCLTEGCDDICSKKFKEINRNNKVGCYCKTHKKENANNNRKQSSLNKYGVENISQLENVKNKKINTNLTNFGVKHTFQSEKIKEKIKETCLEKYGTEYASQSGEVKDKFKQTCLEKYGGVSPMCNIEIRNKSKLTCLNNYGVESPFQLQEIRDKAKQTNLEKYGVEHISQSQQFKDNFKQTSLEKYGTEHPFQCEEVKAKQKKTLIEKYGVEHNSQTQIYKDNFKQTSLEKYGTEHPAQNAEVSEKASKNAYKAYDYIFPSGRIERIQGYEKYMLNDLLQKECILEDDIVVKRSEVPSVWYEDTNGKNRRYFVDCFIKSQNRCIEAKSSWTAAKKKDCIYFKQHALKDAGYKCEIWIYNGKGELVEKVF